MATPIVMPRLGDFMTEGVVTWNKSSGDAVGRAGNRSLPSSRRSSPTTSKRRRTGYSTRWPIAARRSRLTRSSGISWRRVNSPQPPRSPPNGEPLLVREGRLGRPRHVMRPAQAECPFRSTPGARKVAASLGIDIAEVPTSGARITEADVRAYADSAVRRQAAAGCPHAVLVRGK